MTKAVSLYAYLYPLLQSPDFDASKCVHAIHLYLERYHGENCGSSGLEFRHTVLSSSLGDKSTAQQ